MKVMAMLAGGCLLLSSLAHNVQLFPAQLHDLGQRFFQVHGVPSPAHGLASAAIA
jgi:hypothetical protein